jgi:ABC-type glycerol-3-phosphate transport system substrate-binding protein
MHFRLAARRREGENMDVARTTRMTRRSLQGRVALAGVAGAAAAPLAAACGLAGGDGAARGGRRAVTVDYWSRWGGANPTDGVDVKRLPLFNERNAPTRVERSPWVGNHTEFLQKIAVAFAGGTGPDVFTIGTPGIPLLGKQGSLLSVEKYATVKKELADFFAPVQELGKYKGTLYGLNYFIDMGVTMYRKDILAREGLPADRKSLPKTWDQFREWGRKLAKWEGGSMTRIGFNVPRDDKMYLTAVNQLGKSLFNKELTQANFGGVEGERALQMMVDFIHRDRMDALADQRPKLPGGINIMGTGLCAISHGSPEGLATLRPAGMDPKELIVSDFTPEWSGKTTATGYLGGTWAMANKNTKLPDEAVDVLLFLSSPEHNLAIGEATYTVVSRKSQDKSSVAQDPVMRPYYEALDKAWSLPQITEIDDIRNNVRVQLGEALDQKKSVKEALASMISYANTKLATSG